MSKFKNILKKQYESENMNKSFNHEDVSDEACVRLKEVTHKDELKTCGDQKDNKLKRKSEDAGLESSNARARLSLNNSFNIDQFIAESALSQDNNSSEEVSQHSTYSQDNSSGNSQHSAALSPAPPSVEVSETCANLQDIPKSSNVILMSVDGGNVSSEVSILPISTLQCNTAPSLEPSSNTVICDSVFVVPPSNIRYFENIGKNSKALDLNSSGSIASIALGDKTVLPDRQPESHITRRSQTFKDYKYGKVELYAPDTGPKLYAVKGNIISRPIITKNLPEAFMPLPVHGKAESKAGLEDFYRQKIRDYVGCGIDDIEFEKLEEFCSPEYLKTGNELAVAYTFPCQGSVPAEVKILPDNNGPGDNLCILQKFELRKLKDQHNHYPRKLKYRGLRLIPLSHEDEDLSNSIDDENPEEILEPGRDLIFRVRVYRPHSYGGKDARPNRHSVFNNDIVLLGRQKLTVLRDRMGCPNDIGMRVDVSDNPDTFCADSAKRLFPSGFLFINNVFYVDRRAGCQDHSAIIREWARRRQLGDFPVRDMGAVRLDEMPLRLGHPEVYMHQGKCEHLFTFSDVRLLNPADPLRGGQYPSHTAIAQNQSVYCTTCAEFGAKWIVVGCARVPFDPAFFCDTCFKLYLYDRDGNKIGNFKAYSYRGCTVNFLKPTGYPDGEGIEFGTG